MAAANWVTEDMLDAIRQVESGGNNNAVSPRGAVGEYQFLPENVHDMGYGVKKGFDPLDPVASRAAAKSYLTGMKKFHGFTNDQTLQAYNYGPTRMAKYLKKGSRASASEIDNNLPTETIEYLDKVGAEMKIAEKKRLIREYGKQGNAKYPQGMRPVNAPTNPLVSNNAVLSGYNKPNTRGFIGEFVEESMVPAIKDLYGSITGGNQVPVDPRDNKLLEEMGIVPQLTANKNAPLSDADKRKLQYTTQQSNLKAKKASDSAQDKAEYEAYASDLKAKGAAPQSFDRWKTEKTWAVNNAKIAEVKAEKLANKMSSAQNSYDIFISNGGNADDITIEEWSNYDSKRRIMEMKKVDNAAAEALGGTSSTKNPARVNANIVPAITSTGEQHLRSQVDLSTVEKLEEDKKLKELAGEYNKQGDSQYPEGMRPIADAPVPPVQETIAELTKRLGEEYDNSQTDTPDASSVDVKRGIVKDGNGNVVDVPPGQVQGIFNKASELFGDMFTAADLKRMVLYTVGGLVTGGSMEGSFKWAGMQVMKEHSANEQNQATKDAAALVVKERQDAVLRADGVRAKEAYIDAGLKARAEEVKVKANTATAANLANYNLNKDLIEWKTKAPVQVKVPGRNRPVQARWNPNGYYVSARDNKTILNGGRNVEKWADGVYGKNAQRSSHIAAIEGIRTSYENEGDEPDLLGDRAANIYDKYLIKVDEWADEYGYTVDLSTALSRQVLSIAAKQSVEANRGKTKGFITPEHFFDTALLKGFVSSMGGSQKIFDANDGKPIDSAANEALIGHIKKMQQHGAKTGKNTTIASALGDVHKAWVGLEDSERKKYNNDVRKGNSGFAKFALEIKIPKPKN